MKISTFRTFGARLSVGAATLALAVTIGAPANAGSNTGGSSHGAPTHKQAAGENARPIQAMNSRLLLAPADQH